MRDVIPDYCTLNIVLGAKYFASSDLFEVDAIRQRTYLRMSILQDKCAFQKNVHVDSFDSKNCMFLVLILNINLFRAGGYIL